MSPRLAYSTLIQLVRNKTKTLLNNCLSLGDRLPNVCEPIPQSPISSKDAAFGLIPSVRSASIPSTTCLRGFTTFDDPKRRFVGNAYVGNLGRGKL